MSFLDNYLKNYKLEELSTGAKKLLTSLEAELEEKINKTDTPSKFEDVIKEFGAKIADLVERFANYWKTVKGLSFSSVGSTLRFVINIGVEVKQIVDDMTKHLVPANATDVEKKAIQSDFGKDLTFFVWKTVDPLKDKLNFIPFKATIEKKLVRWIAGMAIEFAYDLFTQKAMSANSSYLQTM